MTECERIIKQGLLPESFFDEEVRCEFLVTKERKKIWAIEIDLLLQLDRICKKHNLSYFLAGGSLLGSVRHKGFIPWDDDVDINMKRKDYEKLLDVADDFVGPYFLQTPKTDPNYYFSHTRLVNICTTSFSRAFAFQDMKHGISIDIFPMDNWDETNETDFYAINDLCVENSTYMRRLNPYLGKVDKERVVQWSGRNPMEVYEEIQSLAQQYNNVPTKYLMAIVNTSYSFSKKLRPVEDYSGAVLLDYEGLKFPAPIGYKRLLEIQYGNYLQLPPVEKRGAWHDNAVFDADIPFGEYLIQYKNKLKEELL
ncbi:MAG: LicD family protein [Bacteroidales bacterium]|nr:LicD family protein [Bacteroidales bacterium]